MANVHHFKVQNAQGQPLDLSRYRDKVLLIVNTASRCGFTPQYQDLEALHQKYHARGLEILAFPCNQFGSQEPGSNDDIQQFCQLNYGVSFPMASKVSVKGSDMAPIYKWLTAKAENGVLDAEVGWNFGKFLLDENGKMIAYYPSKVKPDSEEILKYVK